MTLKFAWVAVDSALSVIGVALPIMLPVARYGYDGYKHARAWLPHVELTPRKIDWLHGAGSLAAGSIFGFENLTLPSIPTLLWAASVPGLFLFLRTRPNLLHKVWRIGYYVGRYLNHCVSIATEHAHSHPRAARSIGAGVMVAIAGVGTLHAFNSLFAVAILLGTLKAAYSAVQIALMIAAVRGALKLAANVRRAGCAVLDLRTVDRHLLGSVGTPVLGLRYTWCPGSAPMPRRKDRVPVLAGSFLVPEPTAACEETNRRQRPAGFLHPQIAPRRVPA